VRNDPLFSRPPLDTKVKKHFQALLRRRDWLEGRCAVGAEGNKSLSFDEAELSALKWALAVLFKRYGITEAEIPLKKNM
jgi:hypothetical protein